MQRNETIIMSRKRTILSLAVNAYLIISTVIITVSNLLAEEPVNFTEEYRGVKYLLYFTVLSNIFLGLCSVLIIIFLLKNIRTYVRPAGAYPVQNGSSGEDPDWKFPFWLYMVIMMAVVSIIVTFVSATFYMGPGQGMFGRTYFYIFSGSNFFFHLLNPLIGCAMFIWLIPHHNYSLPECLLGIIPSLIYAVFYTIAVLLNKSLPDFYFITYGGLYMPSPITMVMPFAMCYAMTVMITRFHNHAGHFYVAEDYGDEDDEDDEDDTDLEE